MYNVHCFAPTGTFKTYHTTSKEEAVLIHVEFAGILHYLHTHLEGEEKLVPLKETSTCIPKEKDTCTDVHVYTFK